MTYSLRSRPYRPLCERLEDRLPPGDAVAGALLAWQTTGQVPAVEDSSTRTHDVLGNLPPTLTRDSLLDGAAVFPLLPGPVPTRAAPARAEPTPAAEDLFPEATTHRRALPLHPDDLFTAVASSVPFAAHAAGSPGNPGGAVFVTPPAANYQLDQAVAALPVLAEPPADAGTQAGGTFARFNLGHPSTGPFPSNWFTVEDQSQNTSRRVNLPYPDCKVYVSDCRDVAVLNELDGFNLQPRLSVPFSGPIDVKTVNSTNVFLVSLGSTTDDDRLMPRGYGVGINQIVWDVATNALHVESDELLAQHTRFALFVTTGVRDAQGDPVRASPTFTRFLHRGQGDYHDHLLDAMAMAKAYGFAEGDIAAASVFTTQSVTAVLEKIRDQIKAGTPDPADFLLGPKRERTVFPRESVEGISFRVQTEVEPPRFNPIAVDLTPLDLYPGGVGQLAFGKYVSPEYRTSELLIPPVGTRTGTPAVQGVSEIYFNLFLPSGTKPPGGWPVAIVGHGGGGQKHFLTIRLAASLAARGVATIGINHVGHGGGPLSTLTLHLRKGEPVTFSAGGRGVDIDGDNVIGSTEGEAAIGPWKIIDARDGVRQVAADLMQLVRVLEVGMDVNGDGIADLDASRISYVGSSRGGRYGSVFLGVEPAVRVGVLTVTTGATHGGLAPAFRSDTGRDLGERVPSLLNSPGVANLGAVPVGAPRYHENLPLRNGTPLPVTLEDGTELVIRSPVVNTVAGAMPIQEFYERREWVQLSSNPSAYAPHYRRAPLAGMPAKSILFQLARGDRMVPNPATTATLRAGDLADHAIYYRHDLAYAERPTLLRDPHTFLSSPTVVAWRDIVLGAQEQIAVFFASDGQEVIHPEPARFFEVPLQGPLPEDLNFIT